MFAGPLESIFFFKFRRVSLFDRLEPVFVGSRGTERSAVSCDNRTLRYNRSMWLFGAEVLCAKVSAMRFSAERPASLAVVRRLFMADILDEHFHLCSARFKSAPGPQRFMDHRVRVELCATWGAQT